jgi:hypothetical protein
VMAGAMWPPPSQVVNRKSLVGLVWLVSFMCH